MTYFVNGCKFFKKSWFILLLINIVPAVFLGIYTTPFNSILFLNEYMSTKVSGFFDIINIIFEVEIFNKIYPMILIFVSLILFTSLGLSIAEKYVITRRVSISKPLSGINFTIVPTVIVLTIAIMAIFLTKVVIASVVTILHLYMSGKGFATTFDITVVVLVTAIIALVALGMFLALFLLLPTMIISGYTFLDSLSYAIRLAYKDFWRLMMSIVIPIVIIIGVNIGLSYLVSTQVMILVKIILYMFILAFLQGFIVVTYDKLR